MMSIQGLRQKPSFNQLVNEIEKDFKIRLPDRRAQFLRDSPYMAFLDNETYLEMEDQQNKMNIQQQTKQTIQQISSSSGATASVLRGSNINEPLIDLSAPPDFIIGSENASMVDPSEYGGASLSSFFSGKFKDELFGDQPSPRSAQTIENINRLYKSMGQEEEPKEEPVEEPKEEPVEEPKPKGKAKPKEEDPEQTPLKEKSPEEEIEVEQPKAKTKPKPKQKLKEPPEPIPKVKDSNKFPIPDDVGDYDQKRRFRTAGELKYGPKASWDQLGKKALIEQLEKRGMTFSAKQKETYGGIPNAQLVEMLKETGAVVKTDTKKSSEKTQATMKERKEKNPEQTPSSSSAGPSTQYPPMGRK